MISKIRDKEMRLTGVTVELEFHVFEGRLYIDSGLLFVRRDGKELVSGLTNEEMDWIEERYGAELIADWEGSRIDYLDECQCQVM